MAADHFSGGATDYAKFRPGYPEALFDWIAAQTAAHDFAWDCGCGNGQASVPLAARYRRVLGTDLSERQIREAAPHPGIEYRTAPAEASGLPDASCDLVAVAQALHWFDFERFHAEVKRVLKPGGVLAAWTYQLLRFDPGIDEIFLDYYRRVLAPWWPAERKWVDEGYRTLPFPFTEIPAPAFEIRLQWTLEDLLAYLRTWTATRYLAQAENRDPTLPLGEALQPLWGEGTREIVWPIAMRVGRC
ncbi:MAG: class I SAM-dependent methyltransferase [Ignavibacteria bacterium]